jgi:hypothetical protein
MGDTPINAAYPAADDLHLRVAIGACRFRARPGEGDAWVAGIYHDPTDRRPLRLLEEGSSVTITEEQPSFERIPAVFGGMPRYELELGRQKPIALTIETGASEFDLDLGGIPLSRLMVRQGTGKFELGFSAPNPEPMQLLDVSSGAAGIALKNLANANFSEMRLSGGAAGYELDFGGTLSRDAQVNRIYRVLKPFGADPKARDAARVLRITGTTNSKNGATVRALGDASEKTYRFEDLVEVLVKNPVRQDEEEHGKPGADLYSLAVQRAARGLRKHPQGWSGASLWEGRLTDLQHLRRMRYGEGPMEDFRDRWLFIATTAISWLVVPEVLYREALALAEEAGGWDERRTRSDLSQVFKRARRAARGETIEFMGQEWDPRHHFRNETLIERLEITPEEEREMVVTISAEEASRRKRLRDREYQKRRRRAKGVATRPQYDENRTSSFRKRVAAARQLKNCELSTEQIAERMNVSRRTVQRWLP